MSTTPVAAYSFLPWSRQGLGVYIREGDQDPTVKTRGSIDVTLRIDGDRVGGGTDTATVAHAVQLYGPGDLIGVQAPSVVRTEPRNWVTNFEPNHLPFIEFYDEDFPWRYTPAGASPDRRRLRPWLALAVLEEGEGTDVTDGVARPLPCIDITGDPTKILPPADQLWAWAHVHVNGGLGVDPNDSDALAGALGQAVQANRDAAYSRLMCPRILKPGTAYNAFLIPAFETGRLAGLGEAPELAPFATACAWAGYTNKLAPQRFPVYYRWYFRTSTVGDFEYLVRLLQPRTVDSRVGRRDLDVQDPQAGLPPITRFGGILRLGGALRAPLTTLNPTELQEYKAFEAWAAPYPHPFQTALAALVNLADDYTGQPVPVANGGATQSGVAADPTDQDPWVVPPLYGRWHAQTSRLVPAQAAPETEADPLHGHWVDELNLDPRHRAAAGFGTEVIQANQEAYMEAAWAQVGKVLEANRRIRLGHMAALVSRVWHVRGLAATLQAAPERFLALTAPVQRRVLADGLTVWYSVRQSTVPAAALSKVMRQALRPRGRIASRIGFDATRTPANLLDRINQGEVSAAPPKAVPPGLPVEDRLAAQFAPAGAPDWLLDFFQRHPWARWLGFLLLAVVVLLLALVSPWLALVAAVGLFGVAVAVDWWVSGLLSRRRAAQAIGPETRTPEAVDALPTSPDFQVGPPGSGAAPSLGTGPDSPDAARFKDALRNIYALDVAERAIPRPPRLPLDLAAVGRALAAGLASDLTIPLRVLGAILIPPRIRDRLVEDFGEVMAYPTFDQPMYDPLKGRSTEMFLPNLQLVENNSITLLETNQKFIEAYMVGLNHEFARELLWREYPTDQRGSYFRQFWDVSGFLAEPTADPEALKESLRDIPELHRWPLDTPLGAHDNRTAGGTGRADLVLVIRGELLKKYPTAVIYAHKAQWERTQDGQIDRTRPRRLADLTAAQADNPPRDLVKTPLFEAKVDPDINLLGFDVEGPTARGDPTPADPEPPGWFFVIKERPGDPRFGLDVAQGGPRATVQTWDDLAWSDVLTTVTPGEFLRAGERAVTITSPAASDPAREQSDEDSRFRWRADTHAAELAYILFRAPTLMAVHASEMLQPQG
jgi:hypothetical protein